MNGKHYPTEHEISRVIAREVFDIPEHWIHFEPNGKMVDTGSSFGLMHIARTENYCYDRNALHEVINRMWDRKGEFCKLLARMLGLADESGYDGYISEIIVACMLAEARLVCIAALKALEKWPADWSDGIEC